MKCNEVREKLSPYVDKELDRGQMERIENHLNECPICLEEFDRLRKTDAFLKNLPREDLSKEFHKKLVREMEAFPMPMGKVIHERRLVRSKGRWMDLFSILFLRRKGPWTMNAFDDFPPWSLGHVYLQLIDQNQ